MVYQSIGDVYMEKRAVLMSPGYAVLKCFSDKLQFLKKLSENTRSSGNYERASLHVFTACVQSTFPGDEDLKLGANRVQWDPIFASA